MWHGMLLFLLGLLTGFAEPHFGNVRMGLAAHLEGVMNGILPARTRSNLAAFAVGSEGRSSRVLDGSLQRLCELVLYDARRDFRHRRVISHYRSRAQGSRLAGGPGDGRAYECGHCGRRFHIDSSMGSSR